MRFSVQFTDAFERDLETLVDYIAENRSVDEANDLLRKILAKVDSLETLPARGAIPKELEVLDAGEIRQTLVGPYRVFYEVVVDVVLVIMVADGRRDMPRLLQQRLLGR